jgi:hypothetical protein
MLFAGCTQQEVVSALRVNQINVWQLHVRLHQLDNVYYTLRTGCPRVTIPGQDHQIRLPYQRSHFTTVVETAATITGQGNPCVSAQTVRNRLWGAILYVSVHLNCSFACFICPSAQSDSAMLWTTQSHVSHGCTQIFCRRTKRMFSDGQRSHQTLIQQNIFEMSWINEFRYHPYSPTTIQDLEQVLLQE